MVAAERSQAVTHPAQRNLRAHQGRRREILSQRTMSLRRTHLQRCIRTRDRVRDPHFTDWLRGKLARYRREQLAPWVAIIAWTCFVRRSATAQLAHEDFRQALRTDDGYAPCLRTVRNTRNFAEEIGLVVVDADFDDCRSKPKQKRDNAGAVRKWWQLANQYKPGPMLLQLWQEWLDELARRRAVSGREALPSKRLSGKSSRNEKTLPDRIHGRLLESVPAVAGGHDCTPSPAAQPLRPLEEPPGLVRGQARDASDDAETPRQAAPVTLQRVFVPPRGIEPPPDHGLTAAELRAAVKLGKSPADFAALPPFLRRFYAQDWSAW